MLKGGRKPEAEELLEAVLAELRTMSDADWGTGDTDASSFFTEKKRADPSKAKYYTGL